MSKPTHVTYLDSVRGLAAMTVISEHYTIAYGLPCDTPLCQQILDRSPLHFWWDGFSAVSMFFVLSGLVLSLKHFRNGHLPDLHRFDLLTYTVRRLFRIWLPYLVILAISAIAYHLNLQNPTPDTLLPASDWIKGLWYNHPLTALNMLREGFLPSLPATVVLLPQSWTLTIELVLSLLLPIGLLLTERGTHWLVFFAVFAVTLLDTSIFLLHFSLGLLLARYHPTAARQLAARPLLRRLILLAGMALYTSDGLLVGLRDFESIEWLDTGLGAALILLSISGSARAQSLLSTKFLRHIGKISYSAYLIHLLVLLCITPYLQALLQTVTANHFVLWLGGYLLTFLIALTLSVLSYQVLEINSISLGHRITDSLSRLIQRRHPTDVTPVTENQIS